MRILIKAENFKLFIIFPTLLLTNNLTALLCTKIINRCYPSINLCREDCAKLVGSIKKYRHNHNSIELVNIATADGEIIRISL